MDYMGTNIMREIQSLHCKIDSLSSAIGSLTKMVSCLVGNPNNDSITASQLNLFMESAISSPVKSVVNTVTSIAHSEAHNVTDNIGKISDGAVTRSHCQIIKGTAVSEGPPAVIISKKKGKQLISGKTVVKRSNQPEKGPITVVEVPQPSTSKLLSPTIVPRVEPLPESFTNSSTVSSTVECEEGWKLVSGKKRVIIRGTKVNKTNNGSGLINKKFYHFHPFHPDTTVDDFMQYLTALDDTVSFTVIKLGTKQNAYASFKVGIPESAVSEVLKAEHWPKRSYINEWRNNVALPRLPRLSR